MRTSEEQRSK